MTVWLASGNKHKQQELQAIFTNHTIKLPVDAGINDFDVEETGSNFMENALIKAKALYKILNAASVNEEESPVLADDSGLCVDILGGRPGIYSARYYGINSWDSKGNFKVKSNPGNLPEKLSDTERNILLLEELAAIFENAEFSKETPSDKGRKCRFVCAMALLYNPDRFYIVQETMEGEIIPSKTEIRGQKGFGYDPIVYLPDPGCTVAELSEDQKNQISHRGKAGKAIAKLLCL